MITPLCEIAKKHKMDGGPNGDYQFTERYYPFFKQIRESANSILEIGVRNGNSLRTWKDFFDNAEIHGIDIDERCLELAEDRINIFIGDQHDENFLENIVAKFAAPFDLIIDDGSHKPEDQIFSFDILFPYLNAGGIYAIEDTFGSYQNGVLVNDSPMKRAQEWINGAQLRGWSIRGKREDAIVVSRTRDIYYSKKQDKPRTLTDLDEQIFSVFISMNLIIICKSSIPTEEEFEQNRKRLLPNGV